MFLNRSFIRVNRVNISILLFLVMFGIIHYIKPSLIYTKDGAFRQFGIGYKEKTVIPIWLIAIFLAILSQLAIMYYLLVSSAEVV